MTSRLARLRRLPRPLPGGRSRLRLTAEAGMTTAEYAVGTLAGCWQRTPQSVLA